MVGRDGNLGFARIQLVGIGLFLIVTVFCGTAFSDADHAAIATDTEKRRMDGVAKGPGVVAFEKAALQWARRRQIATTIRPRLENLRAYKIVELAKQMPEKRAIALADEWFKQAVKTTVDKVLTSPQAGKDLFLRPEVQAAIEQAVRALEAGLHDGSPLDDELATNEVLARMTPKDRLALVKELPEQGYSATREYLKDPSPGPSAAEMEAHAPKVQTPLEQAFDFERNNAYLAERQAAHEKTLKAWVRGQWQRQGIRYTQAMLSAYAKRAAAFEFSKAQVKDNLMVGRAVLQTIEELKKGTPKEDLLSALRDDASAKEKTLATTVIQKHLDRSELRNLLTGLTSIDPIGVFYSEAAAQIEERLKQHSGTDSFVDRLQQSTEQAEMEKLRQTEIDRQMAFLRKTNWYKEREAEGVKKGRDPKKYADEVSGREARVRAKKVVKARRDLASKDDHAPKAQDPKVQLDSLKDNASETAQRLAKNTLMRMTQAQIHQLREESQERSDNKEFKRAVSLLTDLEWVKSKTDQALHNALKTHDEVTAKTQRDLEQMQKYWSGLTFEKKIDLIQTMKDPEKAEVVLAQLRDLKTAKQAFDGFNRFLADKEPEPVEGQMTEQQQALAIPELAHRTFARMQRKEDVFLGIVSGVSNIQAIKQALQEFIDSQRGRVFIAKNLPDFERAMKGDLAARQRIFDGFKEAVKDQTPQMIEKLKLSMGTLYRVLDKVAQEYPESQDIPFKAKVFYSAAELDKTIHELVHQLIDNPDIQRTVREKVSEGVAAQAGSGGGRIKRRIVGNASAGAANGVADALAADGRRSGGPGLFGAKAYGAAYGMATAKLNSVSAMMSRTVGSYIAAPLNKILRDSGFDGVVTIEGGAPPWGAVKYPESSYAVVFQEHPFTLGEGTKTTLFADYIPKDLQAKAVLENQVPNWTPETDVVAQFLQVLSKTGPGMESSSPEISKR